MTTLYSKLFFVVAGLVLATGGLAFFVETRTFQHYTLAMTQALNESLASHLVDEYFEQLHVSAATASEVKDDISRIMTANPNIELYIIDKDGRIQGFTVPKDAVLRRSIALPPIRDFLWGHSLFRV